MYYVKTFNTLIEKYVSCASICVDVLFYISISICAVQTIKTDRAECRCRVVFDIYRRAIGTYNMCSAQDPVYKYSSVCIQYPFNITTCVIERVCDLRSF